LQKSAGYEHLCESVDRLIFATREANKTENPVKSAPVAPTRRGRKPAKPPHERTGWLSLAAVQNVLGMSFDGDRQDSQIEKATGVPIEQIHTIRAAAKRLGPLIGMSMDEQGNLTEGPPTLRGATAKDFSNRLEQLLADMSIRAPSLYRQGIEVYLGHFDKEKRDAVFRGEKDSIELKLFLRFLNSLGFKEHEFSWMIRVLDTSSPVVPNWVQELDAPWKPSKLRGIRPKAASGAQSYAKWVGVFPVDGNNQSLGTAMAHTLFFAGVADAVINHMKFHLSIQTDSQFRTTTTVHL
jgi:hypothetical protein